MDLPCFQACVLGYSDSLFDRQITAIQTGYWAAYYTNSKHPKSLASLIQDMTRKRQLSEVKALGSKSVSKPEVDVESYLEMERKFYEKLNSK